MATKKAPTKTTTNLAWLETLRSQAKELQEQESQVVAEIRDGMVERVIVFMDVVGSTAYKIKHKAQPEQWILRVRQFSLLLAAAVRDAKGHVVKFIGDEVMAMFDNVYDAQNLIGRIGEIEKNLATAIGDETRIKVAVDFGAVYVLDFDAKHAGDPQGTVVDRCARIGKYGQAGQVLAGAAFAAKTPTLSWIQVGRAEMKGLGQELVFQLGDKVTVDIRPMADVRQEEYDKVQLELADTKFQLDQARSQNALLAGQLREASVVPDPSGVVGDGDSEDQEVAWSQIDEKIDELKVVVDSVSGPSANYARFLFLHMSGRGDEPDAWNGKTFDELVESKIVTREGPDGRLWYLNEDLKRNRKAIQLMTELENLLGHYTNDDEDELYEYSLTDPQFWFNRVGYRVL